jgi:hypothetical protein
MRASRIVLAVLAVALLAGGGLAMTGHLPWATGPLTAAASAWLAPSADAGPTDAAPDVAVKVQAKPLSSAQLTAPLYHVTFLADCGATPEMKVVLKATVKLGRAVEVHATADPRNPVIEGCIERAVSALQWDASRRTETVTVRY